MAYIEILNVGIGVDRHRVYYSGSYEVLNGGEHSSSHTGVKNVDCVALSFRAVLDLNVLNVIALARYEHISYDHLVLVARGVGEHVISGLVVILVTLLVHSFLGDESVFRELTVCVLDRIFELQSGKSISCVYVELCEELLIVGSKGRALYDEIRGVVSLVFLEIKSLEDERALAIDYFNRTNIFLFNVREHHYSVIDAQLFHSFRLNDSYYLVSARFAVKLNESAKIGNVVSVLTVDLQLIALHIVEGVSSVLISYHIFCFVHVIEWRASCQNHRKYKDRYQDSHQGHGHRNSDLSPFHQCCFLFFYHLFFLLINTTAPATIAATAGTTVRTTVYWVASAVVMLSIS